MLGQRRRGYLQGGQLIGQALHALGLGTLVNAEQARHAALLEQSRDGLVGSDHQMLDQPVGLGLRAPAHLRDVALIIEGELRLLGGDDERSALLALVLSDKLGEGDKGAPVSPSRSPEIAARNAGTCDSAAIPARPSPTTNFAFVVRIAPSDELATAESPNCASPAGYSSAQAATPISRAASISGPSSPAISDSFQSGRSARTSVMTSSRLRSPPPNCAFGFR